MVGIVQHLKAIITSDEVILILNPFYWNFRSSSLVEFDFSRVNILFLLVQLLAIDL